MKKIAFFALLTLGAGVLSSSSVLPPPVKKEVQPTAINFIKASAGFKRDLGSAD